MRNFYNLMVHFTLSCILYMAEKTLCKTKSHGWQSMFKDHSVVPDVISKVPRSLLKVYYEPSKAPIKIGSTKMREEISRMPRLDWKVKKGKLYTVFVVNPDVPSRREPMEAEWQHMTVYNLPSNNLTQGDHVVEYSSDYDHEDKAGIQRLVFLVYKQRGRVKTKSMRKWNSKSQRTKDGDSRGDIHVKTFSKAHKFHRPIAGTFFYIGDKLDPEKDDSKKTPKTKHAGDLGSQCKTVSDCKQQFICQKKLCSEKPPYNPRIFNRILQTEKPPEREDPPDNEVKSEESREETDSPKENRVKNAENFLGQYKYPSTCDQDILGDCSYLSRWFSTDSKDEIEFVIQTKKRNLTGIGFSIVRKLPSSDFVLANLQTKEILDTNIKGSKNIKKDKIDNLRDTISKKRNGVWEVRFKRYLKAKALKEDVDLSNKDGVYIYVPRFVHSTDSLNPKDVIFSHVPYSFKVVLRKNEKLKKTLKDRQSTSKTTTTVITTQTTVMTTLTTETTENFRNKFLSDEHDDEESSTSNEEISGERQLENESSGTSGSGMEYSEEREGHDEEESGHFSGDHEYDDEDEEQHEENSGYDGSGENSSEDEGKGVDYRADSPVKSDASHPDNVFRAGEFDGASSGSNTSDAVEYPEPDEELEKNEIEKGEDDKEEDKEFEKGGDENNYETEKDEEQKLEDETETDEGEFNLPLEYLKNADGSGSVRFPKGCKEKDCKVIVDWTPVSDNDSVSFNLKFPDEENDTSKLYGLGFAHARELENSDFIALNEDKKLEDGFIRDGKYQTDSHIDIEEAVHHDPDVNGASFSRPLTSQDTEDDVSLDKGVYLFFIKPKSDRDRILEKDAFFTEEIQFKPNSSLMPVEDVEENPKKEVPLQLKTAGATITVGPDGREESEGSAKIIISTNDASPIIGFTNDKDELDSKGVIKVNVSDDGLARILNGIVKNKKFEPTGEVETDVHPDDGKWYSRNEQGEYTILLKSKLKHQPGYPSKDGRVLYASSDQDEIKVSDETFQPFNATDETISDKEAPYHPPEHVERHKRGCKFPGKKYFAGTSLLEYRECINGKSVRKKCPHHSIFWVVIQCCVPTTKFPCFKNCIY